MNQKAKSPETSSSPIRQYLRVLKRNSHLVFLSSLLLSIVFIIGVSLIPDIYRATTTILVDPQQVPERYVASTVSSNPSERLNTLTQQVLSSSRLQEIIDKFNLYPGMRKSKSEEEVVDYMRRQITIELKRGSEQGLSSFSISYEDNDRFLVASIANQLAASFVDWNLRVRQQLALDTTRFLSNELKKAKAGLEEQESQLEDFKMKHVGSTPDQLDGNLQALSRLQAELQSTMDSISRLDEERIMLSQVNPVDMHDPAGLSDRGRLLLEKSRVESQLWNLKQQFKDTYPDVVAAREQLRSVNSRLAAMPDSPGDSGSSYDSGARVRLALISKEMERLKRRQAELQRQSASYQGRVDAVPVLETELAELSRNYETSRQNYQSLLDKTLSAKMSEDLERQQQAERFMVLDAAKTPEKPSKPSRLPMMAGAVLLAFLIVAAVTIGINSQMGLVQSEADLTAILPPQMHILATVPAITTAADRWRGRMIVARTTALSVLACAALVAFMLKVRPIL
jgi:polysaccharide biosynthesis transport protein